MNTVADLDIYKAAQATIETFGESAVLHAAQRADELLTKGDTEGSWTWQRIETAISELLRVSPDEGEAVH